MNSEQKPAARGSTIVSGAEHHPRLPVEVRIGGIAAEILYSGGAPGLVAGIWRLNVRVPANAPSGMAPVEIEIGGARSRQGVYVQVQ